MANKVILQKALKVDGIYLFDDHDIERFAVFVREGGVSFSHSSDEQKSMGNLSREVITNFRLWLLSEESKASEEKKDSNSEFKREARRQAYRDRQGYDDDYDPRG